MMHISILLLRHVAAYLLFLAVVLAAAGSRSGLQSGDVVKWVIIVAGAEILISLLFVRRNRLHWRSVLGLRGADQETIERKRAENALAESERLFRATFEQAAVGIAHVAPDGSFRRINQRFCDIIGYSQEEMLSGNFQGITHPDDLEDDVGQVAQLLRGNINTYSLEKRYIRKEGDLVWASLTVSLVRNDAGAPQWFVSVIQDISERKHVEQELSAYRERLKELASQLTVTEERERQRLATDLHDHVCQTLALMRLQLATLRKRITDPEATSRLDEFSASLLQANQDTRHLMFELSSPTLNELGLAVAIAEWLEEEIEKRHGLKTEFQNIGFTQHLDADLRAVLFRNVRELLTNIVKHAQAQNVHVTLQQSGTTVRLVVQDDGIGFDPNHAIADKREHPGFGLFSIQERMVDMGGSMDVASALGEGCTVTLTLPVTN